MQFFIVLILNQPFSLKGQVTFMDDLTLRRAQKGDSAAFEALVMPWEQMLWRLCWRYTRHDSDAQDCMQETMLKAWRQLPGFRGECSIESYLYRICVSCCLDFLRRKGRHAEDSVDVLIAQGFDPVDPAPMPDEKVERQQEKEALAQSIASLPAPMRETFILGALEGRTYEETAALTGVSVGTVKSRLNRARQRLAEKFRFSGEHSSSAVVPMSERRAEP